MLPNQRAYKVPARTILATIGPALATAVAVVFVMHLQRVLVWMLIAAVFTVALYPVVNSLQSQVRWCRRSLATLVVFLVVSWHPAVCSPSSPYRWPSRAHSWRPGRRT